MTSAAKAKGTRAELEVVALYRDHLGLDVRRTPKSITRRKPRNP